ncbi:MAG: hypothetical protein R3F59_23950 [Myxococcota bacterium]
MEHFFTFEHLLRMAVELSAGVCLKLFCDNGRVHWRDFANDFLFFLPGMQRLPGDGLSREVDAVMVRAVPEELESLAAK